VEPKQTSVSTRIAQHDNGIQMKRNPEKEVASRDFLVNSLLSASSRHIRRSRRILVKDAGLGLERHREKEKEEQIEVWLGY